MNSSQLLLNEVRIFGVQNLLTDATVIQAPLPKDPLFKAENLVQNLNTRFSSQNLTPIIAWDGVSSSLVTRASYSSCFVTTDTELAADGHKLVITLKLSKRAQIDGIVLVQDIYSGFNGDVDVDNGDVDVDGKLFHSWNIYVGDSPDYT